MQYNRLNGIVQKALQYTLNGQDKGYTLNYEYNNKKHPHAPSSISDIAPFGGEGAGKPRNYTYDGNGNPTYYDEFKGFRSMVWDEENRLRGINDNGRLHLYTYDHTGERALKSSAESSMAVINGLASAVITHTEDYTAYVSPYFVVQKGKFTKHYFEGSSRVVSKLGEGTFSQNKPKITAGGVDYFARTQKEQEARDRYIQGLKVPPGPPTQHGIYATPEWTKEPYPSIDWETISQNQEPPQGWPRYPRFNEPGDVPGPPVQFGEPLTNANARAGFNFIPNGVEEKNLYFYHPDHLGSSSYITDKNGEVIQHTEYMAFREVLVDEHSTTNKMPYLFNGKELDYETGLYYYGARYYDAKTSLWLNTDPLSGYNPIQETEHYIDGQHNGGIFNPMNMATYSYTYQNPIIYVDPNGKQTYFIHGTESDSSRWNNKLVSTLLKLSNSKYYNRQFNWVAPLWNTPIMRSKAAIKLANHVLTTRKEGEEITLIGHSHGGNVAILAARLIYEKTKQKVNIITIATPAYNGKDDMQNPENQKSYINDHIQIWNKLDGVSGELAGDDYYVNSITTNIEINVDKQYIKWENGKKKVDRIGAHSFDHNHPEIIEQEIKEGKLRKLNKVE